MFTHKRTESASKQTQQNKCNAQKRHIHQMDQNLNREEGISE